MLAGCNLSSSRFLHHKRQTLRSRPQYIVCLGQRSSHRNWTQIAHSSIEINAIFVTFMEAVKLHIAHSSIVINTICVTKKSSIQESVRRASEA
jgi:hypothetical protein